MKDSSPDHTSWGKGNNREDPPYITALVEALQNDSLFQEILDQHGIKYAHILDQDGAPRVKYEGHPIPGHEKPPAFAIFSPLENENGRTFTLHEIKDDTRKLLKKFLTYAVDDDILKKDGASNLTHLREYDEDEKILHYVEHEYAGEKILRYEGYGGKFPIWASSTIDRSRKLNKWIHFKRRLQQKLIEKKITAYWRDDKETHLITEQPDPNEEGVWEGAEDDQSKEVETIVLMKSIRRILEENGLEKDVMILERHLYDDWIDPSKPHDRGEYENAFQFSTDINGLIMNDEEGIMKIVSGLQEEVKEHGLLALKFLPSLEENDWYEDDGEEWKKASGEHLWEIERYKLD